MADKQEQPQKDKDERVRIPLDPEDALRGLLAVDPESEPVRDDDPREQGKEGRRDESD